MSNTLPYAKVVKNGVTDRLRDQIKVMRAMFTKAASENIPIMILGDLFDHSRIDPITLTTVVKTLAKSPVDVYIVPGNHDGVNIRGERFSVEALSSIPKIHYMRTGKPFKPIEWLRFWPIEFATLDKTREFLSSINVDNKINVLLMHNSIVGCSYYGCVCGENAGLNAKEVTSKFDYVFSGHFHKHQEFGKNGMYVGSPMYLRYDDSDRDYVGWWTIDLYEDGNICRNFHETECPLFHTFDWDQLKDCNIKDVMKSTQGDYVRIKVSCTHSELVKIRQSVESVIDKLSCSTRSATWIHAPIYHHTKRIESRDEFGLVSQMDMIDQYVDAAEVNTSGLDPDKLKDVGKKIFSYVESKWQS